MTLCETLLNTVDDHPTFSGALLQLVQGQVRYWAQVPAAQRPGFTCLEAVWMRERRHAAIAAGARPEDVASLLEVLVTEGRIDPFVGLNQGNAAEHLITSRRASSRELRRRLRSVLGVLVGTEGAQPLAPSVFVRAIALDFGWQEPLPNETTIEVLAESAAPADLLIGYRIASALSGDREQIVGAVQGNPRAVTDGILSTLRSRLSTGALQGNDATLAARVIRVIELERVVRGMVRLLNGPEEGVQAGQAHEVEAWFAPHHVQGGPLEHLRQYVLGESLIELLGGVNDTEVRREIERVMEAVNEQTVPGFPSIASTSRRPSDLLRRIRFLVRTMVVRALRQGSAPIYRQFVHRLFGGAHENLTLAAAKLAFERPPADAAQAIVRSDVENLLDRSGVWDWDGDVEALAGHPVMAALKTAVGIEVDSWSAARDADRPALLVAIKEVLEQLEEHFETDAGLLVTEVFGRRVCVRAREEHRFNRGPDRRAFWHAVEELHDASSDTLAAALTEGLEAFKVLVRNNFHREFDAVRLRQIAMNLADNDQGDSIEWLQAWAYVESDGSAPIPAAAHLQNIPQEELVRRARLQPAQLGSSGEPWAFRLADAAAAGHQAARGALLELARADDARIMFQSVSYDAVGRSLAVAIAQTCDAELIGRLYGPNRAFEVSRHASIDQVTQVMAAVRFAKDGRADAMRGLRAVLDCSTPADVQARDRRGWRAIHHAFAAGNVDAAKELVRRDAATITIQTGDNTTFLIEAFRGAATATDGAAVLSYARELLHQMNDEDRASVLGFRGPQTLEGMPLSVVSAVLSGGQFWHELMTLVEAYPAHAGVIWNGVGSPAMRYLLDNLDPIQLAQFCRCVRAVDDEVLQALVQAMDVPLSIRVARFAKSKSRIDSARQKYIDVKGFDLLDISAHSIETGGTMFHELVDAVVEARQAAGDAARDADAYSLAVNVISLFGPQEIRDALLLPDYEGETAVWAAARRGEIALALAYARALGWPADAEEQTQRWTHAARFLVNPDRYQDGVPLTHRIRVDNNRHLEMSLCGDGHFRLVPEPLPLDMDVRAAREWLTTHQRAIALAIQQHIGAQNAVQPSEFINLVSHLAEEHG
jgi:hypothetical protein